MTPGLGIHRDNIKVNGREIVRIYMDCIDLCQDRLFCEYVTSFRVP